MKNETVWIVVDVHSGIPTCAQVFWDEETGQQEKARLLETARPEYDEVGLFCAELPQAQ